MRLAGVLIVGLLASCTGVDFSTEPDAGSAASTDGGRLDAHDVELIIEQGFQHPDRHSLSVKVEHYDEAPVFVEWTRTYDGIDVDTQVISVLGNSGWETRWHRGAEPEPLRRDSLISYAAAADV